LFTSEARRSQNLSYIYLGNTQVATRSVAWGTGAVSVRYQHTDALGSPVAETSETGAVLKRNSYEPYGASWGATSIDGTGYTGHVTDRDTGLTYMQQRYYDPQTLRFVSIDPQPADPSVAFQRYGYAAANPFRFGDPDGRQVAEFVERIDPEAESRPEEDSLKRDLERMNPRLAPMSPAAFFRLEIRNDPKCRGPEFNPLEAVRRTPGPKTDPAAPHNARIRQEGDKLIQSGNRIVAGGGRLPEKVVPTPGGEKPTRRPDILYITPGGQTRALQVGRTQSDNTTPVRRERAAMSDLSTHGGVPTTFVDYEQDE
jgi:RHS repeat-associated protein